MCVCVPRIDSLTARLAIIKLALTAVCLCGAAAGNQTSRVLKELSTNSRDTVGNVCQTPSTTTGGTAKASQQKQLQRAIKRKGPLFASVSCVCRPNRLRTDRHQ